MEKDLLLLTTNPVEADYFIFRQAYAVRFLDARFSQHVVHVEKTVSMHGPPVN